MTDPTGARRPLLICDCDGVLIDSEVLACTAVAEGLARRGIAIGADEVMQRYTGWSAAAMYAALEARFGVRIDDAERRAIDASALALLAARVEAMPGAAAVLAALRARWALCVASSSAPTRLAATLGRAGLAPLFGGAVFSATMVARGKPAPDLFLHAAHAMGVPPDRCTVVEDSRAGVQAAVAAGMRCIGFVGGGHAGPALAAALRADGAAAVVAHWAALPALLDGG